MSIEEPVWVNEVKYSTYDLADLPASIEKEIIRYLGLEYASEANFSLKYVGEFELWGKPIRCWDFGSAIQYATVQPFAQGYYIATTSKSVGDDRAGI